jgi:hypothetical protein
MSNPSVVFFVFRDIRPLQIVGDLTCTLCAVTSVPAGRLPARASAIPPMTGSPARGWCAAN